MYDFDALVAEVLRNKPEVSRESLMEQVQQKKKTVGSGYLTDQGALFLIAGELGVGLQHMVASDLTIKDIHVGANDITIVARVLAVYPVSEFNKKDGSGIGRYRRVNLFDRDGIGRLTIWEDNPDAMKLAGIGVDTPVRVVSAYAKPGLDGKPNLNLGKRGRIEVVSDNAVSSKLASLGSLSKQVEQVQEGEAAIAVDGLAVTDSRSSTFVRRDDNSSGSLTQFELKGVAERPTRVVIWDGVGLPEVKAGNRVRVTNLRQKKGRAGDGELHGDSGTVVQVLASGAEPEKQDAAPVLVKVSEVGGHARAGRVDLDVMVLSKGSIREVSLKDGSKTKKAEVVFGDDTGEITAVAWGDASAMIGELKAGERLQVRNAGVQKSKMGVETLELSSSSKLERSATKG